MTWGTFNTGVVGYRPDGSTVGSKHWLSQSIWASLLRLGEHLRLYQALISYVSLGILASGCLPDFVLITTPLDQTIVGTQSDSAAFLLEGVCDPSGATVQLLMNDQPYAETLCDEEGEFSTVLDTTQWADGGGAILLARLNAASDQITLIRGITISPGTLGFANKSIGDQALTSAELNPVSISGGCVIDNGPVTVQVGEISTQVDCEGFGSFSATVDLTEADDGHVTPQASQGELVIDGPSLLIDTTAPTVTITFEQAEVANSAEAAATVTFADSYGLAQTFLDLTDDVSLSLAGGLFADLLAVSGDNPYTLRIGNFRGEGTLQLHVAEGNAVDVAGNIALGASSSELRVVHDPPPAAAVIGSIADISVANASTTISWSTGGEVDLVAAQVAVSDSNTSVPNASDFDVVAANNVSLNASSSGVQSCVENYLWVRLVDAAANQTDAVSAAFDVDSQAPSLSIQSVENDTGVRFGPTLTWAASDNCGLTELELAIGTSAGNDNIQGWTPLSGVSGFNVNTTTSYKPTDGVDGFTMTLNGDNDYFYSLRAYDAMGNMTETASSAWRLRPVGYFVGTTLAGGSTDLNADGGEEIAFTDQSFFNPGYFFHSTSSDAEIIDIVKSGAYYVTFHAPLEMVGSGLYANTRAKLLVNGTSIAETIADNGLITDLQNHSHTSLHFSALLPSLSNGDEVTVEVTRLGIVDAVHTTPGATLSMSYVETGRQIFAATSNTGSNGSDLNDAVDVLDWSQTRASSDVSDSTINPEQLSVSTAGDYLVTLNIPVESGSCGDVVGLKATVLINDTAVDGASAAQAMSPCTSGHDSSSLHWNGVLSLDVGDVIKIQVEPNTNGSSPLTITAGHAANISFERLNNASIAVYSGTGLLNGTSFNDTDPIVWSNTLTENTTFFQRSSVAPHPITVQRAGNYLLMYSDHLQNTGNPSNAIQEVSINGVTQTAMACSSNFTGGSFFNGQNEGSCSMVIPLRHLQAGDEIRVENRPDAAITAFTSASSALLTLIRFD